MPPISKSFKAAVEEHVFDLKSGSLEIGKLE
jgi:hypothetical protein